MRLPICVLTFTIFTAVPHVALSQVQFGPLFGDHAVLQRGTAVPIWGTAQAGEAITVRLGNRRATTTAKSDGRWIVRLSNLPVGGPYTLIAAGQSTTARSSVLVGDVWLASGQSNMSFRLMDAPAHEYDSEIASAKDDRISMFVVPMHSSQAVESDAAGSWQAAAPESVLGWSAVAYFFGRELRTRLGVPIGILTAAVPRTSAATWTGADAFVKEPELASVSRNEYRQNLPDGGDGAPFLPGQFFNAMIAPLIPYAIRGVVWYQGENDAIEPLYYRRMLSLLINDWRGRWGEGNLPFEVVQLHNIDGTASTWNGFAAVREAQLQVSEELPNVGLAVAIDTGDGSPHPPDKRVVAYRLALDALMNSYGKRIEASGPVYAGFKVVGSRMRIKFTHVGGGLVAKGGPLQQFWIAGGDKVFVPAQAAIDGNDVVVWSPKVEKPRAVRYATAPNPTGSNLYNRAGLPAVPFRTDDWQ